jgi:hypothetical protein
VVKVSWKTSQNLKTERIPHVTDSLVVLPDEIVKETIFLIRKKRVMLDTDLARLYGVTTRTLNQAVKRNSDRFPEDFMFQLTQTETEHWMEMSRSRSQIVTLNDKRGTNIKYRPYAFSEHGILMLSSVLRSDRAVQVNIQIMRTFVRLRELFAANEIILRRVDELENSCDEKFNTVFRVLRQLITEDKGKKNKIGFRVKSSKT